MPLSSLRVVPGHRAESRPPGHPLSCPSCCEPRGALKGAASVQTEQGRPGRWLLQVEAPHGDLRPAGRGGGDADGLLRGGPLSHKPPGTSDPPGVG